ncbi:MAG: outer membrane protein transport protein [Candidatus Schekmanbacteria bacterium]|nr:outer membrane protein transport protein [Candidatus Schekmanbacteria bacterium]
MSDLQHVHARKCLPDQRALAAALAALLPALLLLSAAPSAASVSWRPESGARGLGMGTAIVSNSTDTAAILVNPALIADADGTVAGLSTVNFYHPDGIAFKRAPDLLSPTGYPQQYTTNSFSTVPHLGVLHHPKGEKVAFGFAVNVPFAEDLEWGNGPNRYWTTDSKFSFTYVTPAVAYKILPSLAIGAGLDIVFFDGEINAKVDWGALAGRPENAAFDGNGHMSGDGWGYAANAGISFKPTEKLSFGLSYLSSVTMIASGTRYVTIPVQLQQALGMPAKIEYRDEEMDLRMPEIWRLGASFKPLSALLVTGEVQLLQRSKERLLLRNKGSSHPQILEDGEENLIPVAFENALTYKLGMEYRLGSLALRMGGLIDENGIPDGSMSPGSIDADKWAITAGAGYSFSSFDLDFAYAFLAGDERTVTTSQIKNRITGIPANGVYDMDTHVIGLSVTYRGRR